MIEGAAALIFLYPEGVRVQKALQVPRGLFQLPTPFECPTF
jgi:hypothetical protein